MVRRRRENSAQDAQPGRRLAPRMALALAAFVAVPALIEGLLRAAGFGYPPTFLIPGRRAEEPVYFDNPAYGYRFFPARIARTPAYTALARKEPSTLRVVVLGESAAMGFPLQEFGLARTLDAILRERYPDARFDFINATMTAINSHVLRDMAAEAATHQPDAFVIYVGNNEVIGPYGPGTVFGGFHARRSLTRLHVWLTATRLGQAVRRGADRWRAASGRDAVWEGLDAFADMPMRIDDRRLPACRAQFGQNLRDIIGTARRARAPVFLCTMASNLRDWPPLSSLHRAGLPEDELARWNAAYANGEAALKEDRLQAAASAFLACASIDDTHAALAFRLGQTYERMNDAARARHQYIRARDLDAYRFRTDSELNAIIRRIGEAGAEHVRLVDVEAVVESRSPSGFVGESMFVDHVHFTMDGMLVAAGAVADEMAAVLPALRGRPVRPVDAGACRERLLYSAWAEKEILERLESFLDQRVFRGRPDHGLHAERTAARVDDARRDFDRMDMDALRSVYLRNAEIQPDDWSLRFLYGLALKDRDRNEDAAAAFEAALRDHPRHVPAWNNLARTRISLHQPEDAIRCCEQVLLIDPHDADAMVAWGLALVEMGRYPEAVDRFNEALRRRPDLLDVNGYLAMALFAPGRPEESIARFREELRRNPKSAENHDNFGSILAQIGQLDEAQRHFEEAIRLNPSMASPQFHLGLLHARRNRLKEAETNYRNTIALAPDMLDARINLGNVLARQQKFEAAVAEYQAALQAAPSNPDLLFNVGLAMKALRRFDEARAFFARAMEAKPGFDEARSQLETLEKQ